MRHGRRVDDEIALRVVRLQIGADLERATAKIDAWAREHDIHIQRARFAVARLRIGVPIKCGRALIVIEFV